MTALDKAGVNVVLVSKKVTGCLQIMMTTTNSSMSTLEQYLFQVIIKL